MATKTDCDLNGEHLNGNIDAGRNEFILRAKAHVSDMVGIISEDDIKNAEGEERARLKFGRALNNLLVSDILRVGELRQYEDGVIEDQIAGWQEALSRFAAGSTITPDIVRNGPRRAMSLMKRADKIIRRRNTEINKALKKNDGKGDIGLLERALGRPAVVMFMWDKSGIAQKLVRLAMDTPDIIKQQYFKWVDRINQTEGELVTRLDQDITSGKITIDNIGLGGLKHQNNLNEDIEIVGKRIKEGRSEYKWKDDKWHTAGETNLTDELYKEKLSQMVSAKLTNEMLDGQVKYLKFRRVADFDLEFRDPDDLVKLKKYAKQPSRKQYIKVGKINYAYVTLKDQDGAVSFNDAYIVGQEIDGKWQGLIKSGNAHIKDMPIDGYYRSDYVSWITAKEKNGDESQYSVYKKFVPMENVNETVFSDEFYNALEAKRDDMREFGNFNAKKNQRIEQRLNDVFDDITAYLKEKEPGTNAEEWINETLYVGDVTKRVYRDESGRIRTNNSWFDSISEDYNPRSYTRETLDKMLDAELLSLDNQIQEAMNTDTTGYDKAQIEELGEHIDKLKADKKHLAMLNDFQRNQATGNETGEDINAVILNKQIKSFKKRSSWTDPLLRRKDEKVISEYMERTLQQQFNNELVLNLLESKFKMHKIGVNHNVIDYSEMKVRQALGDPNIRGLFGAEKNKGNYQWVANQLNKLPKMFTGGNTYDAHSARQLVLTAGGAVSMRVLGAKGAMGNNTQILNNYIRYGMKPVSQAWRRINDPNERDKWNRRVAMMGVENMLSAFEHFMLADSKVTAGDLPNIPGTNIPSLTMIDWAKLAKLSQKDFINGNFSERKQKSVDALLAKMQEKYHGTKKQDIRYARKLLHELLTSKKEDSKKLIEKRLKSLVGNIAEDRFKAMVTWKLSWWFEDLPGKELFTFTGGEKNMRKMTALAAIFDAIDRGVIAKKGVKPEDLKDHDDVYTQPLAIEIGRRAVYATMFGMTEAHLGEAFTGIFRLLNQYKGYQTQQTQFEWDTMRSFFDGNKSGIDAVQRLHKAQMQIFKHLYNKKFNKAEAEIAFNADTSIDGEAVVMLRLMYTRFLASGLSTMISLVPFLSTILRKVSVFNFGHTLVRSGESPVLSQAIKMIAFTSMFMMGYDDDDDKYGQVSENAKNSLLMLTTPALLGLLFRDITDTAEFLTERFDGE